MRPVRAAVQAASVGLSALGALNAAYLVRLTDQTRTPGPFLSRLASLGVFPFGPEAGSLSIEDYCPFGPVEGLFRFAQSALGGRGVSFVGPVTLRNLAFLLAGLLLVLLTKKTFCSWLCPFGAVFEALRGLGARLGLSAWRPGRTIDRRLRRVRFGVLAALVALTALAGTLLFKEIDPFYALYSLGSDPRPWPAYLILGALLAGALVHGGLWCHYLCPLGGLLDPVSRLGRIRLARTDRCTRCGACAKACPQRIPVPLRERVTDALCTNCLDCLDACPEPGALELRLEGRP
jgi:polyferredoxin